MFYEFFNSFSLKKILYCGYKDKRILNLIKITIYIVCLFFLFFFSIILIESEKFLNLIFFQENLNNFFWWSIAITHPGIEWVAIVSFVRCLIIIFSQIYIADYSIFNFISSLIFFFLSIILLVTRNSFISFIVGWDYLGVSSILLIMFYRNKITIFNSFLTIFFNRLGDVFMFIVLIITLINFRRLISVNENLKIPILIFIIICMYTKRAQFPLSAWLPAAMSAPTPISAIVHSSTLVTAGAYLIFICQDFFPMRILDTIKFIRILRFFLGGAIAAV